MATAALLSFRNAPFAIRRGIFTSSKIICYLLTLFIVLIMITIMSQTNVQFSVASHMLAALALYHGGHATSAMLAQSVNADPSFVRRVLSKLSKAGLVNATRGKNGACELARAPDQITLLEIYKASEAPATFAIHMYPVEEMCSISCHIKDVMAEVLQRSQTNFERSLSQQTLADVTASIRGKL